MEKRCVEVDVHVGRGESVSERYLSIDFNGYLRLVSRGLTIGEPWR